MSSFLIRIAVVLLLLGSSPVVHAQMQGASGLNSVILKLFGKHDDFTVDTEFEMKNTQVTLSMVISVSGGKLRADTDMSRYRGAGINAEVQSEIKKLKTLGMDRIVSITRPDKNRLYRLYPARKVYDEAALPPEATATNVIAKIKKTPVARETIDGHPCLKCKVVLMDSKNRQQEMTVWEATDLKDFPIKVQLSENGENLVVRNRNIRLTKPLASQFEIPAGYTKSKLPQ